MERNLGIHPMNSGIYPNIVKVKGKDITNPTDITNVFNNFSYSY